jgi:hypothetical protein
MTGLTNAESVATLDARFPTTGAGDYVAYSTDGSTEWSGMTRTAIGATGWAGATNADPSVKATSGALTTAAATSPVTAATIYYAIYSAVTGGVQRTDWKALTAHDGTARTFTLAVGDKLQHAAGDIDVTLT